MDIENPNLIVSLDIRYLIEGSLQLENLSSYFINMSNLLRFYLAGPRISDKKWSKTTIIELMFRDGALSISAKRDEASEESKGNYLRKERRTGRLLRTFVFDNVDTDNVKAEYKDGVLKVNLPKKEVAPCEIRKIDIN